MNQPTSSPQPGSDRAENLRQLGRFLICGGASAATDLACYFLLTGWFGAAAALAKGASYLAGVFVGFFGNKYWTFDSRRRSLAEPATYLALYAVTLLINIGINGALLNGLGNDFKLLAFLVATAATTVLNFLGMRLVTFRTGVAERRKASNDKSSPARNAA